MPGAVCPLGHGYYDLPNWPKVKLWESPCPKCGARGKFCWSREQYEAEKRKLAKWKECAGK